MHGCGATHLWPQQRGWAEAIAVREARMIREPLLVTSYPHDHSLVGRVHLRCEYDEFFRRSEAHDDPRAGVETMLSPSSSGDGRRMAVEKCRRSGDASPVNFSRSGVFTLRDCSSLSVAIGCS